MTTPRVVAALLGIATGAAVIGGLLSTPPATADTTDSAVKVSGKGDFANLEVTVSQTKNLINQVVTVSWTGGQPTQPASGQFGINYLQIMQCWGDDPAGPDRTQCQYGGLSTEASPQAGAWVRSRQVNYVASLVDPKETFKQPAGSFQNVFVPFWAAGRPKPTDPATSDSSAFFDSQVTNEIPVGRTHGDGTGLEFFEAQTVRQAAGLGCGDPVTTGGVPKGRSCWLVIVPRGNTEVDGTTRNGNGVSRLDSSPLSLTNWDNRLVVPLEFQPVGQACPIGAAERHVIGHELAVDAVNSWQPALCAGGGALYSYTQLPDDVARSQVLDTSTPSLGLMTNPIPPDQAPPDHPLVYAPVALSGLAIAFNIVHQPTPGAPANELKLDGQRFTSMKLTPRLVAKLLTQSYRGAVAAVPDVIKNNPAGLTVDPEFLALNPEYTGFSTYVIPPDALVQLSGSDVTSLLWSWVKADPDASAFIAGTADPNGMVVNPANKGLTLPTSTFPRNDQGCVDVLINTGVTAKICTLDAHPFTNDMHDAGLSASRGDTQARTIVAGADNVTPTPKKVDRQVPGQRAVLAVVDAATANRYGLPTASLRNAAGQFVAPTTASLLAGEAAMKPSPVADVLASDVTGASDPALYPLTALSYAATAPSALDTAAGKDYAAFLRYAVGPGQQPGLSAGQLPLGLAPLPDALKAQTTAAAATIEAQAGKTTPSSTPPPAPPSAAPVPPPAAANSTDSNGHPNAAPNVISPDLGGTSTAPGAASTSPDATSASPGGNSTNSSAITTSPGAATAVPGRTATSPGGATAPRPAVPAKPATPTAKTPSTSQKPVAKVRPAVSLPTPSVPAPVWVGAVLVTTLVGGVLAATSSPVMNVLAARRRAREGVMPPQQ